ncbi:hypothetical protein BH23ACT9_BH23ACT9_17590 [soil metagenome]
MVPPMTDIERAQWAGQDADLVMTPSLKTYKRWMRSAPLPILAFSVFMAVRNGVAGLLLWVAAIACSAMVVMLYLRVARLVVTPSEFGAVSLFGRRRMHPKHAVGRVIVAESLGSGTAVDSRSQTAIFVMGHDGGRLQRISGVFWDVADLKRVVAALGVPPTVISQPTSPQEMYREHPGTVGWVSGHPVAFGLLVALVVVVAIVGGVLLFAS